MPEEWLIEGLLQPSERVFVYGVQGGLKSWFTQHIAVQVAQGKPIDTEGKLRPVRPLTVVFVDEEGTEAQLSARLSMLAGPADEGRPWLANIVTLERMGVWQIRGAHNQADIILEKAYDVFGRRPDIIVVDTLSRVFPGSVNNERACTEFHAFLNDFKEISLLFVHHEPKTGQSGLGSFGRARILNLSGHVQLGAQATGQWNVWPALDANGYPLKPRISHVYFPKTRGLEEPDPLEVRLTGDGLRVRAIRRASHEDGPTSPQDVPPRYTRIR